MSQRLIPLSQTVISLIQIPLLTSVRPITTLINSMEHTIAYIGRIGICVKCARKKATGIEAAQQKHESKRNVMNIYKNAFLFFLLKFGPCLGIILLLSIISLDTQYAIRTKPSHPNESDGTSSSS